MPAVFVAAAAGVLLVYEAYRSSQWRQTISVGLAWSAAAALHAGYFLWAGANRDALIGWWAWPVPLRRFRRARWPNSCGIHARSRVSAHFAFRSLGPIGPGNTPLWFDALGWLLALALVIAVAAVVLTGRRTALVAVGAISRPTLHRIYSRNSIRSPAAYLSFCMPLVFFIIAAGIDEIDRVSGSFAAAFACGLLLSVMIPGAERIAQRPYFNSDMRGALAEVNRGFQNGDAIALWESSKLLQILSGML